MSAEWVPALPAFAVAVALFLLPGLIVRIAGWRADSLVPYMLVPALSAAIVAVAANLAALMHIPWSLLPVALVTAAAAALAFALRRWVGPDASARPNWRAIVASVGGILLAGAIITVQLAWAFGSPENISQTFDNVVHLNSIRLTLDAADASAFAVGRTSDIGFYPNGWHSFVTLVAGLTGGDVPVAVNTTNLAVGAFVWPMSAVALTAVLLPGRAAALTSAAALSTAFGAFPTLLLHFGVLYPNTMGYALVPAGLAATIVLLRSRGRAEATRSAVLLFAVAGGIGLAHPNAFLAVYAVGAVLFWLHLLTVAAQQNRARTWWRHAAVALAVLAVGVGLWRFSRTPFEMSRWGNWQSTAQAAGEALLLSPRSYPITIAVSVLIVVGVITVIRSPRRYEVAVPFAVAGFLFVLVSGLPSGTVIRELFTNPWYNDSFRIAALLPVAGIPVAVLGAVTVVDLARAVLKHWRAPGSVGVILATASAVALFSVGAGPNVTSTLVDARASYAYSDTASLLTTDEAALLSRVEETTPDDAVIAGNPWTGTSLVYALAGREVVERHIFGSRTDDEVYLDENLRRIDTDPRVCAVIDRLGVTHVLDFGSQNVFNDPNSGLDRVGLNDLVESEHLELIDSEGPAARLFRVTGC